MLNRSYPLYDATTRVTTMEPQPASSTASATKVQLRHVSKVYASGAKRFYALNNVDLDVYDGEFLALVGPSGCGKSTLLNLIAGFERPDQGEVFFEGQPVTKAGPDRLVLFQEHGLFPWLNVQKNVEFGMKVQNISKAERQERAKHYLSMVHLQKFRKSYPFQLSGGMKQRAAIARALAVEPRMLLMDEPFSALDPRTRDILHLELQSLWMQTRKTIVFVTHSVEEAARLAGPDRDHVEPAVEESARFCRCRWRTRAIFSTRRWWNCAAKCCGNSKMS